MAELAVNWPEGLEEQVAELVEREVEKGFFKVFKNHSPRELDLIERVIRLEEGQKNLSEQIDKRFEQVEKRFEQVEKRFSSLQWMIGIGVTLLVGLMSLFNFFPAG